jgi:crotonobetainyl-CoA:carnitine CoA-transferase CaiB-like acyl-CoA transferase/enoyl-CoA hydratase/carnithine racemase
MRVSAPESRGDGVDHSAGALGGLRVLDLTQVMAGPYCTMMLADMGADVVKVENPRGGDQTRSSWGFPVEGEDSRAFLALNRNKRSACLDLKTEEGRGAFHRLAETADVVVENFRPGVTARLAVDYETLAKINPRLIYASVSGFGQSGPYADRPGYDLIAQAMTGVMSVTGEPGGPPMKSGLPVADLGAGMFCAYAILAAVIARERTGVGQYVETSLYDAALAMSVWESTEYWATGQPPQPLGSANRMSAPYQALRTRDGHVTIGANNERLWERLCEALELPHLRADPRFATNAQRMRNRGELAEALEARLAERPTDEWVGHLLANGVPAGPILDYQQVLDEDPHARARGMVEEVDHAVEGRIRVLGSPVKMTATPVTVRRPPPLLGEHTDEVLGDLRDDEAPAPEGTVEVRRDGPVLRVTLCNPTRRNAITWGMYDRLLEACQEADADGVRVVVIRGAGGAAFAAGTDIRQFAGFDGEAGVAYERRVGEVLDRLTTVRVPVVAVVEGPAVGAGLAIAAACDVVVATPDAVFGAPIARTLGNCLAPAVLARLQSRLGAARSMAMLLGSQLLSAVEAQRAGFVAEVVSREALDGHVENLLGRIAAAAPLTLAALKEIDRRLHAAAAASVDADDLLHACYGSADFEEGRRAFLERRTPRWRGR